MYEIHMIQMEISVFQDFDIIICLSFYLMK